MASVDRYISNMCGILWESCCCLHDAEPVQRGFVRHQGVPQDWQVIRQGQFNLPGILLVIREEFLLTGIYWSKSTSRSSLMKNLIYDRYVQVVCWSKNRIFSIFQGYLREGKCQLALGEAQAATCSFKKVLDLDPDNASAKTDVRDYYSKHMLN